MTRPAKVREVKSAPPYSYRLTIHEGRKRQVRRMFDCLGHRVLALKRIRLGHLELGNLPEGEVHRLSAREVRSLLSRA